MLAIKKTREISNLSVIMSVMLLDPLPRTAVGGTIWLRSPVLCPPSMRVTPPCHGGVTPRGGGVNPTG